MVIPAKELAPYEGLYYNKKTKKPFTGRVDEYFPFHGSEKRVRVSRHLKEGKMHGLRTQYYNDGEKFIEIEYSEVVRMIVCGSDAVTVRCSGSALFKATARWVLYPLR